MTLEEKINKHISLKSFHDGFLKSVHIQLKEQINNEVWDIVNSQLANPVWRQTDIFAHYSLDLTINRGFIMEI